jgi:hypothetical protein
MIIRFQNLRGSKTSHSLRKRANMKSSRFPQTNPAPDFFVNVAQNFRKEWENT